MGAIRKLRMLANEIDWNVYDNGGIQYDLRKIADEMEAENAKLREYAESYAKVVEGEGCGWCPYDMDALCDIETMPMRDGCKLYDELRKLGIEA
jgi:hypothetical protein